MTKEEALAKIKELEQYIEELDNKVGYKDDSLFLLSVGEYEKYKDVIPRINCYWWLRSPGDDDSFAVNVIASGSVCKFGENVYFDDGGIRPAIKTRKNYYKIGHQAIFKGYPFTIIDGEKGIAIATVPISFDKFDDTSNNYEDSEVRKFLLQWKGIYTYTDEE